MNISIEDIVYSVQNKFHIEPSDIMRKGRNNSTSKAKQTIAHIANRQHSIPVCEIARYFGISSPSVTAMIRKAKEENSSLNY
jgi:chromosomal replication initiation ATPase DnaA